MATRDQQYIIQPASACPAPLRAPSGRPLPLVPLDMDDVARCAWGEILQTAPLGSSLFSFMEDLLVSGTDLIWQAAGPGRGAEMRRAFSALFGRFFARTYLEIYHNFVWFAAIDGDNFHCPPNFRVRRKPGSQTEMPDWLCGGSNGLVAIAEAKGSHQRGSATPRSKPGPIRTAEGQIKGVTVEQRIGPKGNKRWSTISVKAWAVMSRWGVTTPPRAPYLYALDPETDGGRLSPNEAKALEQAIARVHIEQIACGLGLLPPSETTTPNGKRPSDTVGSRGVRTWAVRLANGATSPHFLGRFMTPFGLLDIDPQQAKALSLLLPDHNTLRFVGIDANVFNMYRGNKRIEARPRYRIGDAAVVGPDGLVIAPLTQVVESDQIGPIA